MIRARMIKNLMNSYSTKTNIPFNFQLPPQRQHFKNTSKKPEQLNNKQIKMVKLKRTKQTSNKLIAQQPVYKNQQDTSSLIERLHEQKFKQAIEKGDKTQKYYEYQLRRGQDLIDEVPVDPYYQYKISDLKKMMQQRKNEYESFMGAPTRQDENRAKNLKKLAQGYNQAKNRYQMQQFQKYLSKYTGSLKGPNPEDDPESYAAYARKEMPQFLMAQIALEQDKSMNSSSGNNQDTSPLIRNMSDSLGQDRSQLDINSQQFSENIADQIKNQFNYYPKLIAPHRDVPVLPNIDFLEYHSYIGKLQLWWQFGEYYFLNNIQKHLDHFSYVLQQMTQQIHTQNDGAIPLKPSIYSLYLYYRTLPKAIREDPTVRTAYIGLQHNQPDFTYEQKEQALNHAAYLSLPLDQISQKLMDDITFKKKHYLTPHLTDRIFNIHPQFTWDIHEFLNEVKEEKLRSMSTVKEKQQSYLEPPQLHKKSESHLANLPVDYYDNDDGFWDDYIEQKLGKYQKIQPLIHKDRKHFVH